MTYDIVFAGPRNRYTIVTDAGPLIVHNCGYGMGATKLAATCAAGALGGPAIILTGEEAAHAIKVYRTRHDRVVKRWYQGDDALCVMAQGGSMDWGAIRIEATGARLPNDALIPFELKPDEVRSGWLRRTRAGYAPIWGGGLVENVVQGMARVVISEAMLEMRQTGLPMVLSAHDELVYLAPERSADGALSLLIDAMSRPRSWLPDCPLAAEGSVMKVYGK